MAATGWLVHGRAAVGDGRECASDALAELVRRDPALLDDPAADRLRIEVATLAAAQREPAVARKLVEPLGHDRPPEVRADALAVLARCAFEDRPAAVGEATRRATEAWAAVRGADAEIAVAALTFLSATAARRAGHPAAAADHAAEGLARLDDLRPGASAPHLVAALAAEWISALVEAGRAEDACAACAATAKHLVPPVRPTRQIALLRLTVARALAESSSPGAFEALEQAAADASACDAPDLEGLCLSTLGTLREHAGRLDAALESMRRGVAAQRRDRARSERFRAALGALPLTSAPPHQRARPVGRTARCRCLRSDGGRPVGRVGARTNRIRWPRTRGRPVAGRANPLVRRRRAPPVRAAGAVDRPHVDAGSAAPAGPRLRPDTAVDRPHVDAGSAAPAGPRLQSDIAGANGAETDDAAFDPLFGSLGEIGEPELVGEPAGPAARGVAGPAPSAAAGEAVKAHDDESWLATALADLERAWGAPLPELARTVGLRGEGRAPERPSAAPSSVAIDVPAAEGGTSRGDVDDVFDEQAASPWASWTDEDVVGPEPQSAGGGDRHGDDVASYDGDGAAGRAADLVGTRDGGDRVAASAVGCVVVVDVVCAGAAVPAGTALLARLVAELTNRIPSGARMRLDESESTLSVVMPGQERAVAAGWMHRTLPGVFHDVAASDDGALPVGSALRATVHDTDGPVGAQLLQRLDAGRPGPVTAPLVPVRWGVPIAPGSGGRRRRPEDGGRVVADRTDTPGGSGRHREGPNDAPAPTFGRPRPRPEAGNGTSGPKRHAAPPNEPRGRATPGSPAVDPSLGAGVDARQRVLDAAGDMRRRARAAADGMREGAEGRWVAGDGREVAWRDTRSDVAAGQKWYVAGVSGTDLRLDMPSDPPVVARDVLGAAATGVHGVAAGRDGAGVGAQAAGAVGADAAGRDAVGAGTAWPGAGATAASAAGADAVNASAAGADVANADVAGADVAGSGVAGVGAAVTHATDAGAAGAGVAGADVANAGVAGAGVAGAGVAGAGVALARRVLAWRVLARRVLAGGAGAAGAGAAGAGAAGAGAAGAGAAGAGAAGAGAAGAGAAGAGTAGAGTAGAGTAGVSVLGAGAAVGEPAVEAGEGAARRGGRAEGAGDGPRPQAVAGGQAAAAEAGPGAGAAGEDAELSVEGLGLADLLAGALAAYRAI